MISIAVSIVFAIMILISNVRFYEDNISFENKTYSYDNIDSVYYIESRYNVYDEKIDRASYVVLFDDKKSTNTICEHFSTLPEKSEFLGAWWIEYNQEEVYSSISMAANYFIEK